MPPAGALRQDPTDCRNRESGQPLKPVTARFSDPACRSAPRMADFEGCPNHQSFADEAGARTRETGA